MRYALARYQAHQREMAYRIYVSDALRILAENSARFVGGNYMKKRYFDLISTKTDGKSGEEIFADIVKRANLEVKK